MIKIRGVKCCTYDPISKLSQERFEIFRYVLEKLPEVYNKKEYSLELARYIYKTNPEKRRRSLDMVLQIIESAFN